MFSYEYCSQLRYAVAISNSQAYKTRDWELKTIPVPTPPLTHLGRKFSGKICKHAIRFRVETLQPPPSTGSRPVRLFLVPFCFQFKMHIHSVVPIYIALNGTLV